MSDTGHLSTRVPPSRPSQPDGGGTPVLALRGATLSLGGRTLWSDLDLEVAPGEFIAVLGANGTGKTSLLRAVLGEHDLDSGSIRLLGQPLRRGDRRIGYVPQQRLIDPSVPVRARDLVAMGIDGHRWGTGLPSARRRERVDRLLDSVGALPLADTRIGLLSGGEQQRVRMAQALAGDPRLVLADEPFLSLDLRRQAEISALIDEMRRRLGFAILLVTHDINPILDVVDRVLYLAGGSARLGAPDEVLRSDVLSELYRSPVEVIRSSGRVLVVGVPETPEDARAHHVEAHR
ncbi:metal ABC transporter ATP-binding protein [Schaalia naturae]|uniref:Metal ABC transporter ATP-binding protein n=1 Tax=Schaalia naturae TaxID=635203 RepID=A0ABW2SLE9_9ACTO